MPTEREEMLVSVGARESAVDCGVCGYKVWQHPQRGAQEAVLGPSLFGNVCMSCKRVLCDQCIQVGGPTPCPECGRPTEPAGARELMEIGIAL